MRASAKRRPNTLKNMMDDDRIKNRWVASDSLEFYIRKGHITARQHGSSYIRPCLMVANFGVKKRWTGASKPLASQMIDFMKEVEANAVQFGYTGVFVECVYNHKLQPLLRRYGYRQLHDAEYSAPCYFKPTTSIVSQVRHGRRAIQTLQRPSLRRFLQADIDRFWLREQKENLIMLVRRDRVGSLPMASGRRFTLMDLYHYKVTGDCRHADHSLYWSDDETLFVGFLRKLEARLSAEGVHELAICPFVISPWIRTEYGGRTNQGSDLGVVDRHMQQLGYCTSPDPSGKRMYVKSLSLQSK